MIDKIRTEKQYKQVMALIENYLQKATDGGGFSALTKNENNELKELSLLAEVYEKETLKIWDFPISIYTIVEQKANEMNISQGKLAEMLGIRASKLSQILNGKRKPDITFLKAVHEKLGVDGNFIFKNI